jgi:hypothetical protein
MIAGLVGDLFLREVPKHLELFGSTIRHASNGQIAGFLQEAAPLAQLLSSPITGFAELGMGAAQIAQGEVLRRGLLRVEEGVEALSHLAVGNLALSAAGIGVSAAGFIVLSRRIDRVQNAVDGIAKTLADISTKVDQVRQDLIDADLAELKSLAKAMDEGWSLTDSSRAERQWHDVARSALSQQSRFELRSGHILSVEPDIETAEPLLEAVALANSLRVSALAACNESAAAHQAALDGTKAIERLTGNIGSADLVRARLRRHGSVPGSEPWNAELSTARTHCTPLARGLRQREAAVATRTASLIVAEGKGITPRRWLEAVREETETPILLVLP